MRRMARLIQITAPRQANVQSPRNMLNPSDPDQPPTREEQKFQARLGAAWDEIRRFHQHAIELKSYQPEADPQHRLAREFFQIYLDHRPSKRAYEALRHALVMWGNLKGVSERVQEAVAHIAPEEDVWDQGVVHSLMNAFHRDERSDEVVALLETWVQQVKPLKSRSALTFALVHEGESSSLPERIVKSERVKPLCQCSQVSRLARLGTNFHPAVLVQPGEST